MNEIDFEECLKDSPAYRYVLSFSRSLFEKRISFPPRNQLRQATNHIDMLEDRLEQVNVKRKKKTPNRIIYLEIRCPNRAVQSLILVKHLYKNSSN